MPITTRRRRFLLAGPLAAAILAVLAAGLARANTAPCPYIVQDGGATDSLTGLTWQTAPSTTPYTASGAASACAALVLNGVGPGAWRVPTIRELQTIVDEGKSDPAIDTSTFTLGTDRDFWSSTVVAAVQASVWGVSFVDGAVLTYDIGAMHTVICVR